MAINTVTNNLNSGANSGSRHPNASAAGLSSASARSVRAAGVKKSTSGVEVSISARAAAAYQASLSAASNVIADVAQDAPPPGSAGKLFSAMAFAK